MLPVDSNDAQIPTERIVVIGLEMTLGSYGSNHRFISFMFDWLGTNVSRHNHSYDSKILYFTPLIPLPVLW